MATFLESEIARLKIDIGVTKNDILAFQERLQDSNLTPLQRGTAQRNLDRAEVRLATQQAELAKAEEAQAQKAAGPAPEPQPPATASQTVQDNASQGPNAPPAQQATAGGQTVTPPAVTTPTNAEPPATTESGAGVDTGLNVPVKTLEQTQATNPTQATTQALEEPNSQTTVTSANTSPGIGQNDNNVPPNASTKQTELNTSQAVPLIKPQPNVLDKYSSYTYTASVYLCNQNQYRRLLAGIDKKIDGYQLLFQSGGAAVSDGVIRPNQVFTQADPNNPASATSSWDSYNQANRNPFFSSDFYIDNITIETVTTGKGSGAAHMNATMKFTVVEPMGITLLNRLYKAVQNFAPSDATTKVNYTSAIYLMVIRFYGYDADGNIVMPIKGGLQTPGDTSDSKAVVEKFIPFQINRINWSVGSKLVSYEWDCTPVGQLQAGYSARGTIPYDVQLTDTTVGGLLKGPVKYSTAQATNANPGASTTNQSNAETARLNRQAGNTPAPSNAAGAPDQKKTVTQGLMGALNEYQLDLVKRGTYSIPDEYEIEFIGNSEVAATEIENAKLQLPNQIVDKSKTAGGAPATKDINSARPESNPVNMASRSFSITAGQQVLQAIELAIRNSSYISSQSVVVVSPNGTQTPNSSTKDAPLQWFNISMSAEPKPGGLDPKRNDNAYKIKYTVTPFRPSNVASKYFPASRFKGIHKSYPYWFTGKNTAIREYQETLNALYTLTVSGNAPNNSAAAVTADRFTSSMQEIVKYNYSPASNATRAGADGKSLEANANAAEVLYSPGDLAQAKVKIIGDPAWIMQGSMFKPLTGKGFTVASQTGFEPDGTVSFDSQDILFEVVWQRPEDYDINTGTADPYQKTTANGQPRQPLQSRVYICTKVTSEFKSGAFDQTLDGSLYLFPKLDKSNTANPSAVADGTNERNTDETAAERARLLRQNNNPKFPVGTTKSIPTTSVTSGSSTSSAIAKGTQQLLNPPVVIAEPTLAQLQSSQAYIAARRSGIAPVAALQAARNSFAAAAGGSPVTSNGEPVAVSANSAPGKLPNVDNLTSEQVRAAVTAQRAADLRNRTTAGNPTNVTNPGNQPMAARDS
jgi:hypothetical protein